MSNERFQRLVDFMRADACDPSDNCWCCHDMLSMANVHAREAGLLPGVECWKCNGSPGTGGCKYCNNIGRHLEMGMDNPAPTDAPSKDDLQLEVERLRAAYSKFVSYASHGKRGDPPTWYVPQWQLDELSAAFHPKARLA